MDKHNGGPTCKTVYYLIHDCNSVVHHFTITCLLPPPPPPMLTGAMVVPTSPVPQPTRARGMVPQWSPAPGWPTKTWSLCSSTRQVLTPFHSKLGTQFYSKWDIYQYISLSLSEPLVDPTISPRYLWCRVSDHRGM